jgi:hypothetical protein
MLPLQQRASPLKRVALEKPLAPLPPVSKRRAQDRRQHDQWFGSRGPRGVLRLAVHMELGPVDAALDLGRGASVEPAREDAYASPRCRSHTRGLPLGPHGREPGARALPMQGHSWNERAGRYGVVAVRSRRFAEAFRAERRETWRRSLAKDDIGVADVGLVGPGLCLEAQACARTVRRGTAQIAETWVEHAALGPA